MASPKEHLFMKPEEILRDKAEQRSDLANKGRYEDRQRFQDRIKRNIASTEPKDITPDYLREAAYELEKMEKEKTVIKNLSHERANIDNENLDEARTTADESKKIAKRDEDEAERVRRRIQGLSEGNAEQ